MTGVQLFDGIKDWPFSELVRGDPVGTWKYVDIPEGWNLIGFHGTLRHKEIDVNNSAYSMTNIGVIIARLSNVC